MKRRSRTTVSLSRRFRANGRQSFPRRPKARSGDAYTSVWVGWILFLLALVAAVQYSYPFSKQETQKSLHVTSNLAESVEGETPRPQEDPVPDSMIFDPEILTKLTATEKQELRGMQQRFNTLKKRNSLVPCELLTNCVGDDGGASFFSHLRIPTKSKYLLHNSFPISRYFCGKQLLGSGGTLELEESELIACLQDGLPYLKTARPPTLDGKTAKPIEFFWNHGIYDDYIDYSPSDEESFETNEFECSVPCRHGGEDALVNIISIKDTNWELLLTMEGDLLYGEAKVRRKSYQQNQYYCTTSFQSDIPVPYFSWAEYDIQHSSLNFDKAIKGASFLARNCDSHSDRESLVKALMDTEFRVDSLSDCLYNAEPPMGVDMNNKTAIQEKYLFHLAFENQRSDDYITEKLWGALASGTLPIYFGAPNIKEHVPQNSIIVVDDFESPRELAEYLIRLTKDKSLYESYHTWRSKPIDPAFEQKYRFTSTHSKCRSCKWAYAKMHGLKWNHAMQEVEQPHIHRKTCRNKMGLIGHPFKEYWLSEATGKSVPVSSEVDVKTCSFDESNRLLDIDNSNFQRKLYDQDGITDLLIEPINRVPALQYILKLETPVASKELKIIGDSGNQWWLQDSRSRITILTSTRADVSLSEQGSFQIAISGQLRIRIITEDIDIFHKGARKHTNYFGDIMQLDFFNPIEAYKVV